MTPQFSNIENPSVYNLTDLIPTGPGVYGAVVVNRVNSSGGVLASYTWTDEGGEGYDVPDVWVDDDNNIVGDVKLQRGESLWCQAKSTDQALQSAGQVETRDLAVSLRDGFLVCGNAFPTSVKLNDIYPTGNGVYGAVVVNRVNSSGGVLASYTWTDEGGQGYDVPDVWVDDDNNIADDSVILEPGEGLWVQAKSSDWTLTFPAPEI